MKTSSRIEKGQLVITPTSEKPRKIYEIKKGLAGFMANGPLEWIDVKDLQPIEYPYFNYHQTPDKTMILDSIAKNGQDIYDLAWEFGIKNDYCYDGSQITCHFIDEDNVKIVYRADRQKTVKISYDELIKQN
jgi:hypothetical protein